MKPFFENNKPNGSFQHQVECGEAIRYGDTMGTGAHYHEHFECIYCIEGLCDLHLPNQVCRFGAGDLTFIDPMEVHYLHALDPQRSRYIWVKFLPSILFSQDFPIYEGKYYLSYCQTNIKHRHLFKWDEVQSLGLSTIFPTLCYEYEKQPFGYELYIRNTLCTVFLWVLRTWYTENSDNIREMIMNDDASLLLHKALTYIHDHCTSNIQLRDVAKHCQYSYSMFAHFFSKNYGKGFNKCVLEARIQKANILLLTTRKSITEIALETGFSSTSYFIQRFKQLNGVTPCQLRKRFEQKS